MSDLNCFVCGKELETVPGAAGTQPFGGILFTAGGNYGSRIFDPLSASDRLHIQVCDECAQDRIERIFAVKTEQPKPTFNARRFASFDEFLEEIEPDV